MVSLARAVGAPLQSVRGKNDPENGSVYVTPTIF
jgi:hypothetical protein